MSDRVACFIDGGYLDKILKGEFDSVRIDYGKLVEWMVQKRELFRAYYYNCMPYRDDPPTEEQSKRYPRAARFYDYLKRLSQFTVRLGKLQYIPPDHYEQKRVDVLLAIDLTRLSSKRSITRAAILTGDSDFLPAIEVAKDEGVIIDLFYSEKYRPNEDLWTICDTRTPITQEVILALTAK